MFKNMAEFHFYVDAMSVLISLLQGEVFFSLSSFFGLGFFYPVSADSLRECMWPVMQLWIFMTTGRQMFCI